MNKIKKQHLLMPKTIKFLLLICGILLINSITSFTSLQQKNAERIKIIVFNSENDYPGSICKKQFWDEVENHDSIIIGGATLTKYINSRIIALKDTSLFLPEEINPLNHSYAFILSNGNNTDTFYSSYLLYYWWRGEPPHTKYFVNKDEEFSNMFKGFEF